MAEKQSFWTIFSAVLGALAAIVTAVTGLYLVYRNQPAPGASLAAGAVAPAAADVAAPAGGTTYERTPWLGIELRQNDRLIHLRSIDDSWEQFEAALAAGPFELTISRHAEDPSIGILAWHDDSIFQCVRGGELHLPGTGIAGAQFAVPILYLDKEGFNYYDTGRMKRVSDDAYSVFISTIGSGELELPLTRFSGPIHMIVFRVPSDMTVPPRDFELITLRRR